MISNNQSYYMKVRDLTVSKSINLNGAKEFNHLRIANLEQFLLNYASNLDYYSPPFKILAELENKIMYANRPEETILCSYKPDGDVIFRLEEVREEGNLRVVVYTFSTYVS
jgi:predicted GNAT superfamily acetyltransferase